MADKSEGDTTRARNARNPPRKPCPICRELQPANGVPDHIRETRSADAVMGAGDDV